MLVSYLYIAGWWRGSTN